MTQLVGLPKETLTNVERMDGAMIVKRFGEQNGAVEPAADEDGDRLSAVGCRHAAARLGW